MPKKKGVTLVRSPALEALSLKAMKARKGSDLRDLTVKKGERKVLSHVEEWCKQDFKQVNPRTADELKELIGVPDRAVVAGACRCPDHVGAGRLAHLPRARARRPEDLGGKRGLEAERIRAMQETRAALGEFIYGDSSKLVHWRAAIDRYVELKKPGLFIPFFRDIVVQDGGVLDVAAATLVVWARHIKLYGSGTIECAGPTTFDCTSFQGFL